MIELRGKHAEAKVFTDNIDAETISQIINVLNQEFVKDQKVRIMSDCHAGAGCVIGTTMTIKDKVCPNLVGVDIGCGMLVGVLSDECVIDLPKLDDVIRTNIPSGFSKRDVSHPYSDLVDLRELRCVKHVDIENAKLSLGTLGGGNHFIELNVDDGGTHYIVIHSGSRHLGLEVAKYYQEEAYKRLCGTSEYDIKAARLAVIEKLKNEGKYKDIEAALREIDTRRPAPIPKDLAYCEGQLFDDYIHDIEIVQRFASWSRKAMLNKIVTSMGWTLSDHFETIHNYIDTKNMILRKGSISAQSGEKVIIPINMRDGSLICFGKGNPDWNFSAPHGAGRIMSRSKAKELLSMEEYKNEMAGIYSTSVSFSTIDESPMAYKPMDEIIENIKDTVEIQKIIKPIYNFKAGEQ